MTGSEEAVVILNGSWWLGLTNCSLLASNINERGDAGGRMTIRSHLKNASGE
jgi:hypothetical protein